MGEISLETANIGQSDSTEEPKIVNNFTRIQTWANGNIDTNNLSRTAGVTAAQLASAVNEQAGLNDGTTVRRGKCIIATEEARTNTALDYLATPDRVQNVVLPADGLICVAYQAVWRESVRGAARAAITLTGVSTADNGLIREVAMRYGNGSTGDWTALASSNGVPLGLASAAVMSGGSRGVQVDTGQFVGAVDSDALTPDILGGGGGVLVYARAGTYDVGVQFRSTSGSVTAKSRKLWVWTVGF